MTKGRRVGWGKHTGLGKWEYRSCYAMPPDSHNLTVRISYFDKLESVAVPVDLQIGVGF
jgi:hypothetical protein